MAFENTTSNEWKQAFNADFLYAIILAAFLLFNGLALSDYMSSNTQNSTGCIINSNNDSFNAVYKICMDELDAESVSACGIAPIFDDELLADLIKEIDLINPTFDSQFDTKLTRYKKVPASELNRVDNNDIASNKSFLNNELSHSNLNTQTSTPTNTLTTIIPSQETISKNQHRVTSESYIYPAPIIAAPRAANVRNTIQHLNTYTSHTNITTPQNKTFIKSEKNFGTASEIDLVQLPELSFLLSDLIKTANLQGKNIILSFGAKWCLPCKQMEENVYTHDGVNNAIQEDYIFQKLNEKDLETITLKKLFDVNVYPTTIIVDTKGHVINRYETGISKNRMMSILAENTTSHSRPDAIAKVDSFSQPVAIDAAIDFLVSRAENSILDFD